MPRVRTAKGLAQRIDLQYFKKLYGFRRWRLLLSIAVPLLAAGWLLGERVSRKSAPYSAGPVSSAHAVFGQNCALCHVRGAGFSAGVQDKACLACHDAPVHNVRQTVTPACSSCHLEHKGSLHLVATTDAACTQCHGDLHVKEGELKYDPHISGFDHNHPQFFSLRQGHFDPGTINLNHHAHLQPTLRGPNGQVQMQCSDCHRPAGLHQPWPYSLATLQPVAQSTSAASPSATVQPHLPQPKRSFAATGNGHYMAPILYADQCAACHTLQFDPLIAEPAPHGDTAKVRSFVETRIRRRN
jgi:mono/diheme cytochrome c family protein